MGKSELVLQLSDVRKAYGPRPVLRGVSLDLAPGSLVGIVGENGAGKTTLLQILSGELAMDGGTVHRRGPMGYCPQTPVLNDAFTVDQHLRYFQIAYGLDDVDHALDLVERLNFTPYRHVRLGTLSGGTRQKLNLTLALMHDPEVLLLDEPYQGFDWEMYLRFWELAATLRDRGRSILVVSHLAYDLERLDAVYCLAGGVLHPMAPASAPLGERGEA